MVCRDEVVDWFHKLNGAGRLDVMCTLLDSCLPFELRFLGTYMENLGRKDFHQLRDADYRANSFLQHHQSRQAHSDRTALFNLLMDHATLSASQLSSPSGGAPAPGKGHPQSQDEVDAFSTTSLKNGLESVLMNGERLAEGKEVNGVNSSSSGESVDKGGGGDKTVLEDEVLRRRLILFLSLLTATNRDCANAYFKILSEVLPLLDETGWLDNIEEMMLEEMAVLYTIAGNHPAFTFDQRKKLNEVGLIFRDRQAAKQQQAQLSHIITTTATKPAPPMMMTTATVTTTGTGGQQQQQQLYPIHINEQQHYYLGPQQIPISMWQRAPTNPGGAYTSDDLARLQASAQYAFHTFPYTTSLPAAVFMAPQSHHPIAFPVQNRTPNSNNNSNNPLSTPSLLHEYRQQNYPQMIHAHNLGIHAAAVAASAAGGLSVLPAQFSQQQQQQQQKSHHHNNDVIITPNGLPSTTTSTTSVNQTDGNDSEELSWNSPELSPPFQSPSQSLTPSRSQSPIINKPLIQVQQQQQIQQQQQQQQLQQQQQQQIQQQQQQQAPRQNYLPQVVSYTSQSSSEMAPPRSPPPPARPLKSNPNSPGGAIHTNGIKSGRSIKSNNSSNSSSNVPLSSSATTPTSTLNSTPAFSTSTIQQQQHQASHQPVKSATYTSRNDRRHNNHVGNGRNKYNNGSSSSSSSSSSSTSSSSKNNPSSSAPPTPTEYTHHYRSPFSIVQYPPPTNSKAKQGPMNEVLLPLSSTTKADKVQVPPPFSSSNNTNSALAKGPTAIPAPALTPAEPLLSMPPPQALLNHMSIISPVATTAAAPPPNTVLPFAVPLPLVIPPTVPQQSQQLQQIPPNSQVLVEVGGDTAGASQFVHLEDMNIGLNARPKMSCYNCGAQTHYGPECKENTLEEMTKYAYRINFNPDGGDSKESE